MKQTIITLIFSLTVLTSIGQTWQNVGSGVSENVYALIKFDNKLYAGGKFGVNYWDGSMWTALPKPFGIASPLSFAVLNDTLYVGGDFPYSGSISNVYKYSESSWVQVGGDFDDPSWSSTKQLLTYNGELISGGHYTSINGTSISNIASWNGTSWNNLGNGLNGVIGNLAEHDGLLFASGNFTASGADTTVYRIAKWDGLNWSSIDTTHRFNSAGTMISFNGDLIIGNVWDTISGTEMKGVARWTGSNFISMGNNLIKSVSDFWIFNDELYLSGKTYNFNPSDSDDIVLKWNGSFWEQIGLNFNETVKTINDFNNKLFCGGFFTTNGATSTQYIAKVAVPADLSENKSQLNFKVYPNPTSDNFTFETIENGTLKISNFLGQIVNTFEIIDNQSLIDVSKLNAGVYFLDFHSNGGHSTMKLIKR